MQTPSIDDPTQVIPRLREGWAKGRVGQPQNPQDLSKTPPSPCQDPAKTPFNNRTGSQFFLSGGLQQ